MSISHCAFSDIVHPYDIVYPGSFGVAPVLAIWSACLLAVHMWLTTSSSAVPPSFSDFKKVLVKDLQQMADLLGMTRTSEALGSCMKPA